MSTAIEARNDNAIAKPLRDYVPLIREQFELAEKAGIQYFHAAGNLLTEVRETHFEGDAKGFFEWAEKNFGKTRGHLRTYMALSTDTSRKSFRTLDDFREYRGEDRQRTGRVRRDWTAPIDAVADKARREAQRLALEDNLTRQQERDAESKLGLRLIDIGYKVLARELHPDKGGSREAMARLNRVRERLRANV